MTETQSATVMDTLRTTLAELDQDVESLTEQIDFLCGYEYTLREVLVALTRVYPHAHFPELENLCFTLNALGRAWGSLVEHYAQDTLETLEAAEPDDEDDEDDEDA